MSESGRERKRNSAAGSVERLSRVVSGGGEEVRQEPEERSGDSGVMQQPTEGAGGRGSQRRVRASVDLSRDKHRFLKMYAVENEVDGMSVLRTLIDMLEEEPDISGRLLARLGEGEANR